jgi:hypothetical protein
MTITNIPTCSKTKFIFLPMMASELEIIWKSCNNDTLLARGLKGDEWRQTEPLLWQEILDEHIPVVVGVDTH